VRESIIGTILVSGTDEAIRRATARELPVPEKIYRIIVVFYTR
jgi:hypothetical protein